jgi:hypothetical protein
MPSNRKRLTAVPTDIKDINGEINLLIFVISWQVNNYGIEITMKINFGPIQDTKTALLSFHNPRAEFSLGAFGFSAGLGVGYSDSRGDMEFIAKACAPWGCEQSTTGVHILPPNALGLLAQNVSMAGINFVNAFYPQANLQFSHLQDYSRLAGEVARQSGIDKSELGEFMADPALKDMNKGIFEAIQGWDEGVRAETRNIAPATWTRLLATIVTDRRIQTFYPGIDKKFDFPAEIRSQMAERFSFAESSNFQSISLAYGERDKVLEVIREICLAVMGIMGVTATACAAIAAFCFVLTGLAAASIIGTPIGVVALIAGVVLTIAALIAAAIAIIAGITALIVGCFWIFSDKTVCALEPGTGQLFLARSM